MKRRWLNAALLAVAMAVSACGGTEETVDAEQAPAVQDARPGDTHEQAIRCDAEGRCPANLYCTIGWTCRYAGEHV